MYQGVTHKGVRSLTSSIGSIYKNYGYDPLEKMLVLACSMLACSQFFVGKDDFLFHGINWLFDLLFNWWY